MVEGKEEEEPTTGIKATEEQEEEKELTTVTDKVEEEEEENVDRLSNLPDCLLAQILSLLPTKSAAATSALSTRWRQLWTSADLNLDDSSLLRSTSTLHWSEDQRWRFAAISRIFSTHNDAPVRRLRISGFYYRVSPDSAAALDNWVEAATARGVEELVVRNNGLVEGEYLVPSSLLCCESLKVLALGTCRFPGPPLPPLRLSNLRELRLRRTFMTDEMVSDLLSGCTVLERLELVGCDGLRHVEIKSKSVRRLVVETWMSTDVKEVAVEDAPELEIFVMDDCLTAVTTVTVVNAPKLEVISFVNAEIKQLQLGGNHLLVSSPEKVLKSFNAAPVYNLKKLGIKVNFNDDNQSKMLVALVKCLPFLETLVILIVDMDRTSSLHLDFWEQQESFECLRDHLQNVMVKGYTGQKTDEGFVRFLITKAQVLKTLTLLCGRNWSLEWAEIKRQSLSVENKASLDAQIVIKKDDWSPDDFPNWMSSYP